MTISLLIFLMLQVASGCFSNQGCINLLTSTFRYRASPKSKYCIDFKYVSHLASQAYHIQNTKREVLLVISGPRFPPLNLSLPQREQASPPAQYQVPTVLYVLWCRRGQTGYSRSRLGFPNIQLSPSLAFTRVAGL